METKSHMQLHIFFFPYMIQGHFIPLINMARLFASRGVKSTLITTPLNAPLFSKEIQSSKKLGFDVDILVIKFPTEEVGLPQGCENSNLATTREMKEKFIKATFLLQPQIEQILDEHRPHCLVADVFFPWATDVAAKFGIPRIMFHGIGFFALCASLSVALYEPHAKLSSDSEVFTIPNFPVEIKLTRSQVPTFPQQSSEFTKLFKEARESEEKSYGFIVNSFYELEPAFADHYRTPIVFNEEDGFGVLQPHDDSLGISTEIANCEVTRVFINNGRSTNMIFLSSFVHVGVNRDLLWMNFDTPNWGDEMNVTLSIGSHLKRASLMTRFIIVDCPSSYNVILRRPFLTEMAFPTPIGVGTVIGDQTSARVCYASVVKVKTKVATEHFVRTLGGSPAPGPTSC
ncbi:unnamed protein product [Malus baccata var. baccata]